MLDQDKQNQDIDISGMDIVGMSAGFGHQHMMAGMVAIIASLMLHVVLLYFLSGVEFGIASILQEKEERMYRAVELQDVRIVEPAKMVASEDGVAGDGSMLPSIAQDINALLRQPDIVSLQPSTATDVKVSGEARNVAAPSPIPDRAAWRPRQEIMAISKEIAVTEIPELQRRRIPKIERISHAADVVPAMQWDDVLKSSFDGAAAATTATELPPAKISGDEVARAATATDGEVVINEAAAEKGSDLFEEEAGEVSSFKPVDDLLTAALSTYTSRKDPDYGYFRIDLERVGAEVLPVIPKDILLVQDCSASMAEQRLYFCREGLRRCLAKIGPDDRFNVIGFREKGERCFTGWADNNLDNIVKAEGFIDAMRSGGNTDIYASLQEVLDFERQVGRPLVVIAVTDGLSTTGLTRSSDIIGKFSKRNDGKVSVFTLGTIQKANKYLLDLFSYCNRGGSRVVSGGRWDIPVEMEGLMAEVGRPVLADVGFRFGADAGCESYPVLAENMYLDRSLVVYGRYPRDAKKTTFQVVGQAGNAICDMVFDLDPKRDGEAVSTDLRTEWARQKIYHLIGQHARKADPAIMEEIKSTSKAYNVRVPYRGKF